MPSLSAITPIVVPLYPRGQPLRQENPPLVDKPDSSITDDPRQLPPPQKTGLTVVLDLDETLVDAREGPIYVRPYLVELLSWFRDLDIEVIVWSAGEHAHVDRCIRIIDPDRTFISHVICRGPAWLTGGPAVKRLSLLPYRKGRCVLVDNSPFSGWNDIDSAVVVPDFLHRHPDAPNDTTLLYVLQIAVRAHRIMCRRAASQSSDSDPETPFKGPPSPINSPPSPTAAGLIADHPFLSRQSAWSRFGPVDCLRLDVANPEALASRLAKFHASEARKLELELDDTLVNSPSTPPASPRGTTETVNVRL